MYLMKNVNTFTLSSVGYPLRIPHQLYQSAVATLTSLFYFKIISHTWMRMLVATTLVTFVTFLWLLPSWLPLEWLSLTWLPSWSSSLVSTAKIATALNGLMAFVAITIAMIFLLKYKKLVSHSYKLWQGFSWVMVLFNMSGFVEVAVQVVYAAFDTVTWIQMLWSLRHPP